MAYDPNRHRRRSIRLKGYDYSQAGAYFVTLCTQGRSCYFGKIRDGRMILNDAGSMVEQAWARLPETIPGIDIDTSVTMPNHLHGIVLLEGTHLALGEVIKRFKTWTMSRYIKGVKKADWPPFSGRLWQRNYHDRIVRNERELEGVRQYIQHNPLGWEDDDYHPAKASLRR